ncbi:MAG: gliding motility-associated C-terminal domain-containing protein, partial [Bacteroidales bacterium]|nr:gliding motility-associated C-terminal domain-containing protein [Bacteroidales bacterium]
PLTTAEDNQLTYWLRIFNTNGEEVFSGKKLQEKWDGTFKGKPCPPGIYLYRCNAKVLDGGRDLSTTGRITLIR